RGIGVLRFDFTGLGMSGGDFADSNFSSNMGDVVAAADYLRERHEAPRLLVGHSLGGAAVVDIDNATRIFIAAKHPKSFVSLERADHLLTRAEDAAYAAEVLCAWSSRYIV